MDNTNNSNNTGKTSPSKKKKKKKKVRFLRLFLVTILFLMIVVGGAGALVAFKWISDAEPLDVDAIFSQSQTSIIVDSNGEIIDKLHLNENRTQVKLSEVPYDLQKAFIAIEDKRFEKHMGIDFRRIASAAISNIKHGGITAGGSTITQQLIKNVYLTQDKLFKRKVVEIYYALQLERKLTKDQILEAYLNSIDFSGQISGVKEASLYYFGKDVSLLTTAECATLAGVTNNPSIYAPTANFEKSMKRKEIILNEMYQQGYIDKAKFDTAMAQEIVLSKVESDLETSYFGDMVITDVINAFVNQLGYTKDDAEKLVFNKGYTIHSTIDMRLQNAMEEVFQDKSLFPPTKEDANGVIQPEAAMIMIEQSTGEIKAVMGGRQQKGKRVLNRATQSVRQPGSAIKPLSVFAPALSNGYTTSTVVDDVRTTFGGGYAPNNADRTFRGLVTVREGLKSSLNMVAVKIVQDVGVERCYEYLEKFGISTLQGNADKNLSTLALGGMTVGVKPVELAAAYTAFPNGGVYSSPISFTKVVDKNGTVVLENKSKKEQVISPEVAYLMVDMMKNVISNGTGTKAAVSGVSVAGKTGTTDDKKDAWFVGYSPYYTAAVWMGHDQPAVMNFSGGSYPARLWSAVMKKAHEGLPKKEFTAPNTLTTASVCSESGKRPTDLCKLDPRGSMILTEKFVKGTVPGADQFCTVHVAVEICAESNKLVSSHCPTTLRDNKIFIKRPVPLSPDATPLPGDYKYQAPSEICPIHTESSVIPPDIVDPEIPDISEPEDPGVPEVPEEETPPSGVTPL